MAIPIKKEPSDLEKCFFGVFERCVFCRQPSRHWHERTNNCVCQRCAKAHKVSELRDWRAKQRRRAEEQNA